MNVDDCPDPSRKTLPEIFDLIRESGRSGPDALQALLREPPTCGSLPPFGARRPIRWTSTGRSRAWGNGMIARMWHGRVRREDADRYHEVVAATGLQDYGASAGIRAVYYLQRHEGDVTHVVTLTFWDSWDAIRGFAGDDVARAKYYPEDEPYLLEKEPTVTHYEVVDATLRGQG